MPAPGNDAFASPTILTGASGTTSGNMFDATKEGGEPNYVTTNDQSVWYKWTCPATGWYKWTIPLATHVYTGVFGSDFSAPCLALLPDGTLAQMTSANAITDSRHTFTSGGGDHVIAANCTSGSVYYLRLSAIRAGSTFNSGVFSYDLNWTNFTPPANNDFASAVVVGSLPANIHGTTFDATFQVGTETLVFSPSEATQEQSVWYKFTPAATARYRIAIPSDSLVDVGGKYGLAYYNGFMSISTGSTLATYQAGVFKSANFTVPNTQVEARMYVDLTASTDYYIRVFSPAAYKLSSSYPFNGEAYEFDLEVTALSPPANDNYASPTVMTTTLPGSLTNQTTKDATAEPTEPDLPYDQDQSVWYSFTPSVTGQYRMRIPLDSLVYQGWNFVSSGELTMSLCPAAGLTNHTLANTFDGWYEWIYKYPESGWQNPHDGVRFANLVSGTEYRLKVCSNSGTGGAQFNSEVLGFDLEWELPTPSSNDNFSSAQTISGASGTQAFVTLGATAEVGEPRNFYWDDEGDGTTNGPSVWFTWTAPSSGWFKFHVEPTVLTIAGYNLTVYTGSTLTGLTTVNSVTQNSEPADIAPTNPTTSLGFQATNGTTYKIQVSGGGTEYGEDAELSWATMAAPTGDTAATAITGPFAGMMNNYGNTDNDLPPNLTSLLSGHSQWWYNTGAAGKTKWYKFTATDDVQMQIFMQQWPSVPPTNNAVSPEEVGLIAYKGADYASLVVAQSYNEDLNALENVAMMMEGGDNNFYGGGTLSDVAATDGDDPIPKIDVAAGETLWVCVFGMYDDDYWGDGSVPTSGIDAFEFDAYLQFDFAPPPNDDCEDLISGTIYGYPNYEYDLSKTHWDDDNVSYLKLAGQFKGASTYGATAQPGEPAHAGFPATRSVWFVLSTGKAGNTKIWVESDVDCVMSVYQMDSTPDVATLVLIDDDDDSGVGSNPEVTITTPSSQSVWVCVDSKTPGFFDLRYEWINTAPVIPANDNFANAEVHTGAFSATGTTVGASGEYFEWDTEWDWSGPADTVWYKYIANETKLITIDGRVLSNNWDGWYHIEVYTGPDKDNLTKVSASNQGRIFRGPFFPTATNQPIYLNVTNGETYYIRVCTRHGESESFEIYVDAVVIYVNIQAISTKEEGPWNFTVPIDIQVSSVEVYDIIEETIDAATPYVNIQVGGTDAGPTAEDAQIYVNIQVNSAEFMAKNYNDAATVYYDIQIDSHDCQTKFETTQLVAHIFDRFEHVANHRWANTRAFDRFEVIAGDGLEEC